MVQKSCPACPENLIVGVGDPSRDLGVDAVAIAHIDGIVRTADGPGCALAFADIIIASASGQWEAEEKMGLVGYATVRAMYTRRRLTHNTHEGTYKRLYRM